MLFALICTDKPGALNIRLETRAAHLDHIATTGVVEIAGPFLERGQMVGSLVIINVASMAEAEAWAAADPYAKAGLFESVKISEWKKVVG